MATKTFLGGLGDYFGSKRGSNALIGLGTGLLSGADWNTGFAKAGEGYMKGDQIDSAYEVAEAEKAQRLEELNKTVQWLQDKGRADLVPLVESGNASLALTEAMKGTQTVQPIEINGQLVDPSTGAVIGDYRTQGDNLGDAPSGYMWKPDGTQVFVPGGPADPSNPMNSRRTNQGMPSATIQKEIIETDEGLQAGYNVLSSLDTALQLNGTATDGPFADVRSAGGALLGDKPSQDAQLLNNIVTANALESLKATFGAAPTEGERKILLEIQGSINQPRATREAIFKRARVAAEKRIRFNEEKARGLRSGSYFEEGYSPVAGGQGETSVDSLLDKYR